jgi:hypothetical protein
LLACFVHRLRFSFRITYLVHYLVAVRAHYHKLAVFETDVEAMCFGRVMQSARSMQQAITVTNASKQERQFRMEPREHEIGPYTVHFFFTLEQVPPRSLLRASDCKHDQQITIKEFLN